MTQLARMWGFGKGKKANDRCRAFIKSRNVGDEDWVEEPSIRTTKKLRSETVARLDADLAAGKGERQKFIGERG